MFRFKDKKELLWFSLGVLPILIIGGIATYILANPILDDLKQTTTKYVLIGIGITLILVLLMFLFKIKQLKKLMIGVIVVNLILSGIGVYLLTVYIRAGQIIDDSTNQKSIANFYVISLKDSGFKADQLKGKSIASMDASFWGDVDFKQIMADDKKNPIDISTLTMVNTVNYIKASEMLLNGDVDLVLIDNVGFAQIDAVNPDFQSKIEKIATFKYDVSELPGADINVSQEPFTVLLAGLDNRVLDGESDINTGRTDAIIIATFNPKTMRVLMVSIPRDSYLPIACQSNYKDKITHAGINGIGCTVESLQNAFTIPIDYYVVVNFDAVVAVVDAMGGIEVDVPISFCEQNSVGAYGEAEICLEPGVQTLNGQQALALARHRKSVNDIIRGKNQMLIIQAVVTKFAQNASKLSIPELLTIVEGNFKTNFGQNQFGQFMTLAREIGFESVFSSTSSLLMEKMTLETSGDMINGASVQIPYIESIKSITYAINQVAGREPVNTPTEFAFDPNIVVSNLTRKPTTPSSTPSTVDNNPKYEAPTFPDFRGQTLAQVRSWCGSVNATLQNATISCKFVNLEGQSLSQDQATFRSATVSYGSALTTSQTITFTFEEYKETPKMVDIQNFIGKTVGEAASWCSASSLSCQFTDNGVVTNDGAAIIETQSPNGGQVAVNSTINFTVKSKPVSIDVPTDISTVGQAVSWANSVGVTAAFTLNGTPVSNPNSQYTVSSPGGQVTPGSTVTFALQGVVFVPTFTGKTVNEAKNLCGSLTCVVTPEPKDPAINKVLTQSVLPDTIVPIGTSITLTITTE